MAQPNAFLINAAKKLRLASVGVGAAGGGGGGGRGQRAVSLKALVNTLSVQLRSPLPLLRHVQVIANVPDHEQPAVAARRYFTASDMHLRGSEAAQLHDEWCLKGVTDEAQRAAITQDYAALTLAELLVDGRYVLYVYLKPAKDGGGGGGVGGDAERDTHELKRKQLLDDLSLVPLNFLPTIFPAVTERLRTTDWSAYDEHAHLRGHQVTVKTLPSREPAMAVTRTLAGVDIRQALLFAGLWIPPPSSSSSAPPARLPAAAEEDEEDREAEDEEEEDAEAEAEEQGDATSAVADGTGKRRGQDGAQRKKEKKKKEKKTAEKQQETADGVLAPTTTTTKANAKKTKKAQTSVLTASSSGASGAKPGTEPLSSSSSSRIQTLVDQHASSELEGLRRDLRGRVADVSTLNASQAICPAFIKQVFAQAVPPVAHPLPTNGIVTLVGADKTTGQTPSLVRELSSRSWQPHLERTLCDQAAVDRVLAQPLATDAATRELVETSLLVAGGGAALMMQTVADLLGDRVYDTMPTLDALIAGGDAETDGYNEAMEAAIRAMLNALAIRTAVCMAVGADAPSLRDSRTVVAGGGGKTQPQKRLRPRSDRSGDDDPDLDDPAQFQTMQAYVQAAFYLARAQAQTALEPPLLGRLATLRASAAAKRMATTPDELHWDKWPALAATGRGGGGGSLDACISGAYRLLAHAVPPLADTVGMPAPLVTLDHLAAMHVRFDMPRTVETNIDYVVTKVTDFYSPDVVLSGRGRYRLLHLLVFSPRDKRHVWVQLATHVPVLPLVAARTTTTTTTTPTKASPAKRARHDRGPPLTFKVSRDIVRDMQADRTLVGPCLPVAGLALLVGDGTPADAHLISTACVAVDGPLHGLLESAERLDVATMVRALELLKPGAVAEHAALVRGALDYLSTTTTTTPTTADAMELSGRDYAALMRQAAHPATEDAWRRALFSLVLAFYQYALGAFSPGEPGLSRQPYALASASAAGDITVGRTLTMCNLDAMARIVLAVPVAQKLREAARRARHDARFFGRLFPTLSPVASPSRKDAAATTDEPAESDLARAFFNTMHSHVRDDAVLGPLTPAHHMLTLALVAQCATGRDVPSFH